MHVMTLPTILVFAFYIYGFVIIAPESSCLWYRMRKIIEVAPLAGTSVLHARADVDIVSPRRVYPMYRDTWGFANGKQVLESSGRIIVQSTRKEDYEDE